MLRKLKQLKPKRFIIGKITKILYIANTCQNFKNNVLLNKIPTVVTEKANAL